MTGYQTRARIIALMAEQGVTAAQMSARLGWAPEYVTRRILGGRGALTVSEVSAIARLLDVPVTEIAEGAWYGCATCGAFGPRPVHFDGCTETDRDGAEELLPAVPR